MQRLEVSCAVRLMHTSLGAKGLIQTANVLVDTISSIPSRNKRCSFEIGHNQALAAIYLLTIINHLLTPFDVNTRSFKKNLIINQKPEKTVSTDTNSVVWCC